MPNIEYHGIFDPGVNHRLKNIFADAPYAGDFEFVDAAVGGAMAPCSLDDFTSTGSFLRIFASPKWLAEHKTDLLKRLKSHFGVQLVEAEWHPRKT